LIENRRKTIMTWMR